MRILTSAVCDTVSPSNEKFKAKIMEPPKDLLRQTSDIKCQQAHFLWHQKRSYYYQEFTSSLAPTTYIERYIGE